MIAEEMFAFQDMLAKQGIIFCYSGYMTEEVLNGIGNTLKHKLAMEKTDKKIAQGVFALFVEQVQNVIRYSAEKASGSQESGCDAVELSYGLLTVGRHGDGFFIACANMVPNQDVDRLRENLTKIKNMDQDSLKALYKEILRGDVPQGSRGAGVGFVDIARRATHGFEFDFTVVNSEHTYFALKTYM